MINKILSNQSKTITGAAILLGAASFVSRFIGIIRDRILAHLFGAGATLDAYYAAFRIPDLIYNLLIVGALSAGFIPIFTKLIHEDEKEAWRMTNSIINILGFFLVILCFILYIFTPQLTKWLVPGFSADDLNTTICLTRIMFLSPILLGLSGIVSSVLQSFKAFFIFALTPIIYNVGIIFGALCFVPFVGIKGLAYGVILGAALHLCIQLPTLFQLGFRYQPILSWGDKNVKKIWKMMIPRTLGLAVTQLNLLVITTLASTVGVGSITVFNFANNIQHFPIGIVGISFAMAAFPTLTQLIVENKKSEMIDSLSKTIRQIIFFTVPLMVIFMLLRAQIVRVVLGSGQFTWSDTINTADTLAFFTLSLFAQALIPLLIRAFFAIHDTWTPFLIGLISALINIIGGLYLKDSLGVSGLALAFSFSMITQLIFLWVVLRSKLGTLNEALMFQSINKITGAAIISAICVQSIKTPIANLVDMNRLWGIMTQGTIAGISGLLIYCVICYVLKLEEMQDFHASLKRRFIRMKNIQEGEIIEADEI